MRDIDVTVYRLKSPRAVWPLFAPHHYLRQDLSSGCRAWLGVLDDQPVVFGSAITMPSGTLQRAWREHRTVVLPDFQGMGIGPRMSEWMGEWFLAEKCRFYSRTTHPRIGEMRMKDPKWRATGKNKQLRKPGWRGAKDADHTRLAYSHEYVGAPTPPRAQQQPPVLRLDRTAQNELF